MAKWLARRNSVVPMALIGGANAGGRREPPVEYA